MQGSRFRAPRERDGCKASALGVEYWSVGDDSFALKVTVAYAGVTFALSATLSELGVDAGVSVGVGTGGGSVEELLFKLQLSTSVWCIWLPSGDLKIKIPSPDSQRRPASMLNPSCSNSQRRLV